MQPRLRLCLIVFAVVLGMLAVGCPYVRVRSLDEARVETLRAEISTILAAGKTCTLDADCGVVFFGSEYVSYAPATVDQDLLDGKIAEYRDLEQSLLPPGLVYADIGAPVPTVRCENSVCIAGPPAH